MLSLLGGDWLSRSFHAYSFHLMFAIQVCYVSFVSHMVLHPWITPDRSYMLPIIHPLHLLRGSRAESVRRDESHSSTRVACRTYFTYYLLPIVPFDANLRLSATALHEHPLFPPWRKFQGPLEILPGYLGQRRRNLHISGTISMTSRQSLQELRTSTLCPKFCSGKSAPKDLGNKFTRYSANPLHQILRDRG